MLAWLDDDHHIDHEAALGVSLLVAVGCLAMVASYLQLVQLVDYRWGPLLAEEDYVDL